MKESFVCVARTLWRSALFIVVPASMAAQADIGRTGPREENARIVGRVVDAKIGAGITDVVVSVEGTSISARSVIDGRFTISQVPAGSVDLLVKRLGYAAKRVSGVSLSSGKTIEQNVTLDAPTVD